MTLVLAIVASLVALSARLIALLRRKIAAQAADHAHAAASWRGPADRTGELAGRSWPRAPPVQSRCRSGEAVSIAALALDHFRTINDTHGHPYGDDVLRAVAQTLRNAVRPHDTVARLGGVKFALLLPGAGSPEAFAVAERGRESIARITAGDTGLSSSAASPRTRAGHESRGATQPGRARTDAGQETTRAHVRRELSASRSRSC
jgi:GGDEF domain-containing protein